MYIRCSVCVAGRGGLRPIFTFIWFKLFVFVSDVLSTLYSCCWKRWSDQYLHSASISCCTYLPTWPACHHGKQQQSVTQQHSTLIFCVKGEFNKNWTSLSSHGHWAGRYEQQSTLIFLLVLVILLLLLTTHIMRTLDMKGLDNMRSN